MANGQYCRSFNTVTEPALVVVKVLVSKKFADVIVTSYTRN